MRKFYLAIFIVVINTINMLAVDVTIKMNSISRTMELINKTTNEKVEVGSAVTYSYNFETEPGEYIVTGFNTNGVSNGTLEIEITEESSQTFSISTITTWISNSGWIMNQDYFLTINANSNEGKVRVITTGESTTAGRETFLINLGDSFRITSDQSEEKVKEGYMSSFNNCNTVTATSLNAGFVIPMEREYSITVPTEAHLFVGLKSGSMHYAPFTEISPKDSIIKDNKKEYIFTLGSACTYNFKVSQPGKLTNGGIFTMTTNISPMVISEEMLNLRTPKFIDYDVTSNTATNVADILLNVNREGELKMKKGDSYQLLNLRSWQLTNNTVGNYFIEPDYHYTIIDMNGDPCSDIVEIDKNGLITAKGKGSVIVQVTYDAINLQIYNSTTTEIPASFYGGNLWSAIWPENTGTFVLTVDQDNEESIKRNMFIPQDNRVPDTNLSIDSEHDVFYYLSELNGYEYTFTPEGVSNVSIANPQMDVNISKYEGFKNIEQNADGSYTVLLTLGRNIIKLTSETGASEYQVATAKPVKYEIENVSNPGFTLQPGDEYQVQFYGLFSPANKLAGIYNMSTSIVYNDTPNGSSLISSSSQYKFAGSPEIQIIKSKVEKEWNVEKTIDLKKGALQMKGYGSEFGAHREVNPLHGIGANFTALSRHNYFGALPDISISVVTTKYFKVVFEGVPAGAEFIVKNKDGEEIEIDDNFQSIVQYGKYDVYVKSDGYSIYRNSFYVLSDGQEVQSFKIDLKPGDENLWDGISISEPMIVSQEESDETGGIYNGLVDYYKISKASELAWFAIHVNSGNRLACAILTSDIDLGNFEWTPIGNSTSSNRYGGTFDGFGYRIEGLYINANATYQALFGYMNEGNIKNITVEGDIINTKNYTAGLVGYVNGATKFENCINEVNVSGAQYTAGLFGYINNNTTIINCHNKGNITATSSTIGGIAGQIQTGTTSIIDIASNSGNITSSSNNVGGIVGSAAATKISNVINTGNIKGNTNYVAGISSNTSADGSIQNALNIGNIITNSQTYIGNAINGNISISVNENCYSIKSETGYGDDSEDKQTIVNNETLELGEIAWKLGEAFGQDLNNEKYPVLKGEKVFKVDYSDNLIQESSTIFTNGVLPVMNIDGYMAVWLESIDGEEIYEVEKDSNLFVKYTESTITGTDDVELNLSAYPNPFKDYIFINSHETTMIYIYSLSGELVISQQIYSGQNRIETINIEIYFVVIS